MEQVEQGKFSCKSCGKVYKWKPDFAGKKVKCKCGYVMTAPAAPPVSDEPDLDALYDLADDGKQQAASAPQGIRCPSCTQSMEPGSAVCTSCGFNLKTGTKSSAARTAAMTPGLAAAGMGPTGSTATAKGPTSALQAYGSPRKGLQQENITENNLFDIYIPAGLLVFGLVISLLQLMKFSKFVLPFPAAMTVVGVGLVVNMVMIGIGCLLAIKMVDIAFGSPGPAALKIAAIAIAPGALANIISYLIGDPIGMVGASLAFAMYWALFYYLFDLDMSEIWILTSIVCLVRMWLAGLIVTALLGGMLSIGGGGGGVGPGGGATVNDDAVVAEIIELGHEKDAQKWLEEGTGRLIGDLPRGEGVQIVTDLYALGAKEVLVKTVGPQASDLMVKLPTDAKKRKAIFNWEADFAKKHDREVVGDKGGNWLLMEFMFN